MFDEDKDKWMKITNSVFNRDKLEAISNQSLSSASSDSESEEALENVPSAVPANVLVQLPTPITNDSSSSDFHQNHCNCHCDHEINLEKVLQKKLDVSSRDKTRKSLYPNSSAAVKQKEHLLHLPVPDPKKRIDFSDAAAAALQCKKMIKNEKNSGAKSKSKVDDDVDDGNSSKMTRQMEEMESRLKKLTSLLSQKTHLIDRQKIIIQKQSRKLSALIMGDPEPEHSEGGRENENELRKEVSEELKNFKRKNGETCDSESVSASIVAVAAGSNESKGKKVVGLDILTYRIDVLEEKMENFLQDLPKRIESQLVQLRLPTTHKILEDGTRTRIENHNSNGGTTSGFRESKSKWKTSPLIKPRGNLTSKYRDRLLQQQHQEENGENGKEKINFEEKVTELEKIVDNLKQFFLLLVLKGEMLH